MIVFPNAKINIGLYVTEKRPDGFHNLETFFYPIGLSDILEIGQGEGRPGEVAFTGSGTDVCCPPEKNLAVRAYRLLASAFDLPAVRIHLHKVIPFGAGLGGGSADAAFMLDALNRYFSLHLSPLQLQAYAAGLGSDCAFFIPDRPAFACGKGDELTEMELSLEDYRLVLVKPAIGVSTPEAYRGIVPAPAPFDLRRLPELPVGDWKGKVENDFERTVFARCPVIRELKERLYAEGAVYASMSGSGSAVYGLFRKGEVTAADFPGCFVWREE